MPQLSKSPLSPASDAVFPSHAPNEAAANLLLVDDDEEVLESLGRALSLVPNLNIFAARTISYALEIQKSKLPQVAVIDLSLEVRRGVESGFELLSNLLQYDPSCRVLVLTGNTGLNQGIRAINVGAANFLNKPCDLMHLQALVREGFQQALLRREYLRLTKKETSEILSSSLVGTSDKIAALREELELASRTSQPLLLSGETGTGKGLCASLIHKCSPRKSYKFVGYQPSFATADLVQSDLFGHRKGSFTGAVADRKGLLAEAHQGTLFLDEVDELPKETQICLLSVLQEKKFRPLGSTQSEFSDFRIICASNADLQACVDQGKLRRDFYHRLAHFKITLPPLRDRLEDIPLLVNHLISQLSVREHLNVFAAEERAISQLIRYSWPGNIRELESVIEGAAWRAHFNARTQIQASDIHLWNESRDDHVLDLSLSERVEVYRQTLIKEAISKHQGNQAKAAETLKIDRASMRRMMNRTTRP